MHLETAGDGPAMLLLHAFPLDGRMWRRQIDDLAADHRLLAPDMPGFGGSQRPEGAPNLDDWAHRVVASCKAAGVESALVAGCSMGGYLAFAIHRLYPHFARAFVLIDTRATVDSQDARRTRYEMVERARHEGTSFLTTTEPPVSPHTKSQRPDVMAAIVEMMRDATPVGVMGAQRAMASRKDARGVAASIRVPCAVLYGLDDPVIPRAEAEQLAQLIPGAAFVPIQNAGHLPPIETPDEVTSALRALSVRSA
jgi:pimeloyl-ACP methyl ester carboxylesterase